MLITTGMVIEHNPCGNWTRQRLDMYLGGKGKTLKQILRMWSVPWNDRIWFATRFLSNEDNRAFAVWCARQYTRRNRGPTEYIDSIISSATASTKIRKRYLISYWAWAAFWEAYWAADRATYWIPYWKVYRKQRAKLLEIVEKYDEEA